MTTTLSAPVTATTLPDGFPRRHVGPDDAQVATMLARLGHDSLDALMAAALPEGIDHRGRADLPPARSEAAVLAALREQASRTTPGTPLIGMGYHPTVTPAVIRRNVLENPAWYTAYTPYQAEISQGRLEALLHFQTMVCDLTGLDLANASLLDEATAAAEAVALAHRATRGRHDTVAVDADVHPQTLAVVTTRAEALGLDVRTVDLDHDDPAEQLADTFGLVVQYPGSSGQVRDVTAWTDAADDAGAVAIAACDPLALLLLAAPGDLGFQVAVGSTQRFGVPLWYGGPHAGFIAVTERHRRMLPGRLVGVSVDADGNAGLRLALQTREQHIRRERATSNICTAQSLPAIASVAYAIFHGPSGLRRIAREVHDATSLLVGHLRAMDLDVVTTRWFDTVTVAVDDAAAVHAAARADDLELREVDAGHVGIAFGEGADAALVARVVTAVATGMGRRPTDEVEPPASPLGDQPDRDVLDHRVFHDAHAETELMRLLRRWSDRDLALDRSMIPLGSCTMKLNAAAELEPISWPEFADLHPFVPPERAAGLHEVIDDLRTWLAELTGFAQVSLQPNAGSQGEFAGLLAIRRYHEANGDPQRTVVLIPASAHGTNAASAAMAGLDVEVVACDDDGNVDLDDLRARCERHADDLAGLMVTYPSTHGVFETAITTMIEAVHEAGGQVYFDGANLNALVGWVRPGDLGADVAHLNLHKTFAIPHGGGGPGVGPIGVAEHLVEFLPTHPVVVPETGGTPDATTIAAAPWGSAGILTISWAYLAMMGGDGLEAATAVAVLAANDLAHRLEESFPVLYRGRNGLVAHECIVDLRAITDRTGVTNEDVAKRLIDHGFHAPTMSFPVPGTLMVEPTESESLREMDRFVDAMTAIRVEIGEVEDGGTSVEDSPLRHAPHTAAVVTADTWDRAYPRSRAAFPLGPESMADKYWPPIGRIDNAAGDRNPICACPPMTEWQDLVEA
ncbi:aminomethyl-transferring glycine dehydrogenase [Salsipaludibacter albus]|uniref:aminomethyl-transferring glycine dehydrogenase n=1 Tax=Salsipaludibacter albus TaxID=2849650 RepID=UPI001EE4DDAC|nr:aminomethyl-transferring glycine dehydrogenase [Salsipaludibacter albus]MBY5162760.1 aminomethyl-transferring glycine dehydrogenase [Salsipaludibacter albus]